MQMNIRKCLVTLMRLTIGCVATILMSTEAYAADSRIKDIVNFEGIRDNMLVGYGIVVGLDGTGDNLKNSAFTQQGLEDLLSRMGINTRGANLKTKNVAAVTVTATLPPFSRQGSRIDVAVSTLGDSKSLQGGTLLATPLLAADGNVYAVAQGAVAISGFEAPRGGGGGGSSISKNISTSGYVSNGAIVEQEIAFSLASLDTINMALKNPDMTTAKHIAETINRRTQGPYATPLDPGTVALSIPTTYKNRMVAFLSDVEQLVVTTDQSAKIVVDQASGTIVMGENVKIDTVAVAQGNLVVEVRKTPAISQPLPFAPRGARTVVQPVDEIIVNENTDKKLALVRGNPSLKDLVAGLNALGVGPRDLITILQTIKAAGALQAEIEAR